jgi:hypothetical protein
MRNQLLAPTAALLGLAATAQAQVIFNDTFTSGTAAEAGYHRFGTTNTTLAVDGGNLDYGYATGASNRSGVIKQFTSTTIAVGETLTFSFTIDSRSLRLSEDNSFRWSIGNISTAVNADFSSAEPFSGGTRRNYVFSAATGTSVAFNQHSAGFSSPVNGGTVTAISGITASNFAASSTDAFSISVSFTRTVTGLSISRNFGGSISSGSFATTNGNDFVFNTIAFSLNNAGDYGFSLDNVSVSVIPEPSSFAALAGLGALGFVSARRRRRA